MALDNLPDGWRWLSTWDTRVGDQHTKCGPTGDYSRLMKAANTQKIRAYKQDNAWVVNVEDAIAFCAAANGRIASILKQSPTPETDHSKLCESVKSLELALAFWGELISSRLEEIVSNTRNSQQ